MDKRQTVSQRAGNEKKRFKNKTFRGLTAKMENERRKDERLKPGELTFVALRPDFTRLGKIIDISRGGIRFQYMAPEDQETLAESLWVDVFQSASGYYVPSVPCKVVYERRKQSTSFPVGIEYRQCGLRFSELSADQSTQLALYLANHTTGRV